jgi:predicted MFS family arabinose efflux permease
VVTSSIQSLPRSTRALLGYALLVSLGAAVGQGFGRFGYTLLLPSMQQDLGWNYAQAGLVNSANALGYFLGALAVGPLVARWGVSRVVRYGLLTISLSLIATGLTQSFWLLLLTRIVTGGATALVFVGGAAVVLAIDASERSDLPVGVYYAGPGIGIAVSGIIVPWLLSSLGWDWRYVWMALGVIGLLIQLIVEVPLRLAQRTPQGKPSATPKGQFVLNDYLRLWAGMLAYALFGLGYVGYMTFVIAFLKANNIAPLLVQGFWVLLGICAALSGFTWRPALRRFAPHINLCLILLMLAIGAVLPVVSFASWSLTLSAVLFGSSFLVVMTALTAQVRQLLPAERWTNVMGNATAIFAFGQLLGPTLTGIIADSPGGLVLGLRASAALLGVGALIALVKPRPAPSSQ